jgi:peptidoglycan hydrolase-like protein with peptidoglycan-binding domain
MIAPSTWTRYWVEMDYDSTPGRVVVSVWMADETQEPIQLLDKLSFSDARTLKKFWIEFNTSQYGRVGGELVAYVRNVVVLSGLSDPTAILEKPIGGDFVMPPDAQSNIIPSVSLTSPTNSQVFVEGDSVTFGATASDSDGSISKVDFYQGSTLINSDTSFPYSYVLPGVLAGSYVLTAKAYDNIGATSISQGISISVSSTSTTTQPTIPLDTTPPSISTVSVFSITESGATVTWTTNESSTSSVQYGLTTAYGSTANSSGTTSHSVTLTGLTPNTTYNYRITAKDTANNTSTSVNQTFVTSVNNLITTPPPPTPPSGGGGGGGGTPVTPTPTPVVTPTPPVSSGGGAVSQPVQPPQTVATPTQPPPTVKAPVITRNLTVGSKGADVAELQTYLKSKGYLPTGTADGHFGYLTRDAVQRYQCSTLKICSTVESSGYGIVGPKTRAALTGTVTTTATTTPTTTSKLNLTRTLYFGMRNTDVTTLQNFLISKGYLSQGNASGYFGPLTRQAVQRFQCDKLRICSGTTTTGYGVVGPRTRGEMGR